MRHWICDTCGQRILRARDGWLSGTLDAQGRAEVELVHHAAASPWVSLGGCSSRNELASMHLPEALGRDAPLVLRNLLDAVGSWEEWALAAVVARLATVSARSRAERPRAIDMPPLAAW